MKKAILFLVLIILSLNFVVAENMEDVKEIVTGMDEKTDFLDNPLVSEELMKVQGVSIPSYLQFIGSNDVINVYDMEGDFLLGIRVENRVISEFLEEETESDLDVDVDFNAVLRLYGSEDPLTDFMSAYDNGLIEFRTKNFMDGLKLGVSLRALTVYGWLS